jgi:hypothetical protein
VKTLVLLFVLSWAAPAFAEPVATSTVAASFGLTDEELELARYLDVLSELDMLESFDLLELLPFLEDDE